MKERPILFSAPMVRAILEDRKTQTRRVIKPQPQPHHSSRHGLVWKGHAYGLGWSGDPQGMKHLAHACPYGQTGDLLWVRESYYQAGDWIKPDWPEAEWEDAYWSGREIMFSSDGPKPDGWRSRPSIHLERKNSRITLEVTEVHVERLNDICDGDAQAEGVDLDDEYLDRDIPYFVPSYKRLWESINGPGSWDANPWVWVVEFKKLDS